VPQALIPKCSVLSQAFGSCIFDDVAIGVFDDDTYYPGKKDHHKRVTTESTERHGKGKLIRILFSVYFGGFRG